MIKYKQYLENNFEKWQAAFAILAAVIMAVFIIIQMCIPVDAAELANHYEQLEAIKNDVTTICELENANIEIDSGVMTITLKGEINNLKAFFDADNNCINAVIEDNRIGSSIFVSIICVIIAAAVGFLLAYALLSVACIPILAYHIFMFFKSKFASKKSNK